MVCPDIDIAFLKFIQSSNGYIFYVVLSWNIKIESEILSQLYLLCHDAKAKYFKEDGYQDILI